MQSVTCPTASSCWAVGRTALDPQTARTLITRYNGSDWVPTASPSPGAGRSAALFGVSCAGPDACWAVGVATGPHPGEQRSLLERYAGSAWTITSSGQPARTSDALYGVTCVTASDCWAVGSVGDAPTRTLVLHYDGSSWATATSPAAGSGEDDVLRAVTCADANGCWAVGSGGGHTLIARYDGGSWKRVPSKDTAAGDGDSLSGVSCATAGNCWAVGQSRRGSASNGLIEEDTGSGWTLVDSPAPALSRGSSLTGVACAEGSNCFAVGAAQSGAGRDSGLIAHYDGRRWALVGSPALGHDAQASFAYVTCPSEDDCWVVGRCSDASGSPCRGSTSLIEFYDLILPDGH